MVRRLSLIGCALAAAVAIPAAAATTERSVPVPQGGPRVLSVGPVGLRVGRIMVIRGSGFVTGRKRNMVFFQRTGARPFFAPADYATSHTIIMRVPAKLALFLIRRDGQPLFTRFRLRVLSDRLGPYFTAYRRSPLIGPGTAVDSTTVPSVGRAAAIPASLPALPALPSGCSLGRALDSVNTAAAAVALTVPVTTPQVGGCNRD